MRTTKSDEGNFEKTEVFETIKPIYDSDNPEEVIDANPIIVPLKSNEEAQEYEDEKFVKNIEEYPVSELSCFLIAKVTDTPEAVIDGFGNYYFG